MTTRLREFGQRRIAGKVRALSPTDLGLLWWDGTDASTMWQDAGRTTQTVNNTIVAQWKEKNSATYITRTAGNFCPTWLADAGDGSAAIQYNSDAQPDFHDFPSAAISGSTSVEFWVLKKTFGFGAFGTGGVQNFATGGYYDCVASSKRYIMGTPAASFSAWHLTQHLSAANRYEFRINDRQWFRSPINTVAFGTYSLGSLSAGSTSIGGPIRDLVIVRNRILTGYERAGLMAWFANRAGLTLTAETPGDPVLVAGGTTAMRLRANLAYCPLEIAHTTNGRHYLTIPTYGSSGTSEGPSYLTGNSTVINYSSTFFGPTHGGQTSESATLSIDGSARTFPRDAYYSGTSLVFTRQWVAGTAMRILEQSTITNGSIVNAVTLTGIDATKTLSICYGRLWGLHNRFTNWATYDSGGALVGSTSSGTLANAENNAQTNFDSGTRTVLMRDPSTNDTISFRWTGIDSLSPNPFIQDQSGINKIYLRLGALETTANQSPASIGETITITNAGYSSSWPPSSPTGL